MNIQEQIPNVATSSGPGFCILGGIPYLAWKGESSDQALYYSKASSLSPGANGLYSWQPQTKIPNVASSDGPALAGFGGSLYMAWKGESSDTALYFSKLDNGNWTPQVKLPMGSTNAPALVATDKALFMAWKGENDNTILFSTTTDGKTWSAQKGITFGKATALTSSTPALAAFGSSAYLAWKGGSDNSLWWSKCTDGAPWSNQQKITFGTSTGPALVCDSNGAVWISWKAANTTAIYYSSLTNESKNEWSPQVVRYGVATSDRPAMAAAGKGDQGIMLIFKGANGNQGIWYGSLLLPVASSITFALPRQNIGQGSASSFAIQGQLILTQTGSCTFSGTFFSENSILEGPEDWNIVFAIKDGAGHVYTFTTSGQSSSTQNWNLSSTNIAVLQNWAGLVITNPNPADTNSWYWKASDSASLLNEFGSVLSEIGVITKDVVNVIGEILLGALKATGEPSAAAE